MPFSDSLPVHLDSSALHILIAKWSDHKEHMDATGETTTPKRWLEDHIDRDDYRVPKWISTALETGDTELYEDRIQRAAWVVLARYELICSKGCGMAEHVERMLKKAQSALKDKTRAADFVRKLQREMTVLALEDARASIAEHA